MNTTVSPVAFATLELEPAPLQLLHTRTYTGRHSPKQPISTLLLVVGAIYLADVVVVAFK